MIGFILQQNALKHFIFKWQNINNNNKNHKKNQYQNFFYSFHTLYITEIPLFKIL